jgi:low temperature requirement protein LtrA
VFLIGNLWFKGATTGRPPLSHLAGLVGLALLLLTLPMVVVYQLGILATSVLVVVAIWEYASLTRAVPLARPPGHH